MHNCSVNFHGPTLKSQTESERVRQSQAGPVKRNAEKKATMNSGKSQGPSINFHGPSLKSQTEKKKNPFISFKSAPVPFGIFSD